MEKFIALIAALILAVTGCGTTPPEQASASQEAVASSAPSALTSDSEGAQNISNRDNSATIPENMIDASIQINGQAFKAKFYDNESTRALMNLFPLKLSMDDLYGNEKYHYLSKSLPTDAEPVETIKAGDIMLYGSECLVVFYDSFPTSYHYTRLGYIIDVEDLLGVLGDGSISVEFMPC